MEILPTFYQTHGLTPLKKCQFLDFINFLFLLSTKVFSLSRIWSNTFSRHFLAEIKIWKNCQFFDQNHGPVTPLEKYQFFGFINLLFLLSRKVFSLSRISSKTFSRHFFNKIKRWKNCLFLIKPMD